MQFECFPNSKWSLEQSQVIFLPSWWKYFLTQEGSHASISSCNCVHASLTGPSGKVLYWVERWGAYLEQSSQAMFPEVSLIVRSETNAGYSVSQGSRVCFNFWAARIRKKKKIKIKNAKHRLYCDWQSIVTQSAVPLLQLCDFSRHSIMHYFLISRVISSAKQLYKL